MEPKLREKLEAFLHQKEVIKELRRIAAAGQNSLVIGFEQLLEFDKDLAKNMLDVPADFFEASDAVLEGITKIPGIRLRVKELPEIIEIRHIRAGHVSKFIQVEGIVTRAGEIKPEAREAVFKCRRCDEEIRIPQVGEFFREPLACYNPNCRKKGPFDLVVESTVFRDWQSIQIQEPPEKLRGGRMPRRLDGIIRDDFVDKAVPGNHVTITGVLQVFQERQQRLRKKTFRKILFVSHIEVKQKGIEEAELTEEDEEEIKKLTKDPWVANKITQSIAPAIYGYEAIKEAIALQLFGCNPVELPDGTRIRGDTHVLLCGDPGTAKSQILKWVSNVAPRGLYTSGMKATGAGLCVAPDSLIWVRNGLIPISDLVENHFGNRSVSEITAMDIEPIPQFNSTNPITSLWKIPSPKRMVEVHTQYGKMIEVTPETKVMTEKGWKKAKDLSTDDYIVVPMNYGDWNNSYPGIAHLYPTTVRIKNRAEIFKKISSKIKNKRKLARSLGISEDKIYYRWLHDDVRGAMTLGELQKICAYFKINMDDVLDGCKLKCQLRHGRFFRLSTKLLPEIAYFVGLIAGDGSLLQKRGERNSTVIRFSNNDLKDSYSELVKKLFGNEPVITPSSEKRSQDFRFGNRAVFYMLRNLGIQKPEKLFVPREIVCNRELLLAYLRGLFDTDGSVYDRKNHRDSTRGQIELTTIYRAFAEQIQNILFRLGIPAYLIEKKPKITVRADGSLIKSRKQYRLYITQNGAIDRFAELIGFSIERKKEKLEKIVGRKKFFRNTEYVPAKIKKVRIVPLKYRYIYDLTVDGSHSFIVNGFLVHNTAAAVRDEIGGGWTLEAGALVIADGGLASIDEFEKMNEQDAAAILESLEQQTISVAKAGIVATLNTRTAVLAATNPKYGRFDANIPPAQQLALDPVLLSRFDLVLVMRDEPRPDADRSMAQHVLQMHTVPKKVVKKAHFAPDFLRKIIIYTRKNIDPKLEDREAQKVIENFFVDWRKVAVGGAAPLPITVRQLEAIIRLAKSNARMRLSDRVTMEDTTRAINLIKKCLQEAGMDLERGMSDIDLLMTGVSKTQRERYQRVLEIIKELEADYGGAAPLEQIKLKAEAEGIRESFVNWMIEEEKKRGHLYAPTPETVSRAVK